MTLAALEKSLGPEAHQRCFIFVSHEDKDLTSGNYHAALKGTPWHDRLIVGVKGAHLQVRFIEEAAPLGSHIVVCDDNIDRIMVELAEEKHTTKTREGGTYWTREVDARRIVRG